MSRNKIDKKIGFEKVSISGAGLTHGLRRRLICCHPHMHLSIKKITFRFSKTFLDPAAARTEQTERREEPTSTSMAAGSNQTKTGAHLDLELLEDGAMEVGIQVIEALDDGGLGG